MKKVSREAIKLLLESEDSTTLSIYLPTHRFPTPVHIQEDKIRLKNLIRAGKEALEKRGVEDDVISHITSGLEDGLYDDDTFWQHTTEGLALFSSPAGMWYFHLPMECDERVSAGENFDITPLLVVASYDNPYYVLALATHGPKLLKGDMYGIEQVEIELPESPEKALNIDELHANSKTDRPAGNRNVKSPGAKAHGQGDSNQAGQEEKLKFFRMVDDKVLSSDRVDESLPILLAGTDDEVSSYRDSSRMKTILEESVSGNYTEAAPHDIHDRSWPLIWQEAGRKKWLEKVEQVNSLLGTGRASTDIADIVKAAGEGRVETLLLNVFTVTRDTVTDISEPITKLVFSEAYEKNDTAACGRAVFDQGGEIVGMLQDDMPNGASEAAIYRY